MSCERCGEFREQGVAFCGGCGERLGLTDAETTLAAFFTWAEKEAPWRCPDFDWPTIARLRKDLETSGMCFETDDGGASEDVREKAEGKHAKKNALSPIDKIDM